MTIYDVTGYKYPDAWLYTYEVCDDGGHGCKVGEFEQFNILAVRTEMQEVKDGSRTPEPHHKHLQGIGDKVQEDNCALPEHWMDDLMDYIDEVNAECKGDYD